MPHACSLLIVALKRSQDYGKHAHHSFMLHVGLCALRLAPLCSAHYLHAPSHRVGVLSLLCGPCGLGCIFLFSINLIFGQIKPFLTGFPRIFFPAFSGEMFHTNVVLKGVAGIPVFSAFTGFFRRNSCETGIPVTPNSSGI